MELDQKERLAALETRMHAMSGVTEKLAVVTTKMEHVREQQKTYAQETREAVRMLSHKVDELTEVMNRGKGAFAVSLAIAALIGGSVAKLLTGVLKWMEQ